MNTEQELISKLQQIREDQNLGLGEIEFLKAMFKVSNEILKADHWAGDVPQKLIEEFERVTNEIRKY